MSRNFKVVLFASILFGLSVGIYDFALPFYLKERSITFQQMGYIFALSSVIMFIVRIYLGNLSDRLGRKLFYSLALVVSSVVNFFTPFAGQLGSLAGLKAAREGALFTREVMHPVVLFEDAPKKFLGTISISRGFEFFFQGVGTIIAGYIMKLAFGFSDVFWISGSLLAMAFLMFLSIFREHERPQQEKKSVRIRDLFDYDLHPNLKILGISSFIFTLGLTLSHSFYMPLFFSEKFHVSTSAVAVVLMIHRFCLAVPMLFAGLIPRRWFRFAATVPVIVQGIVMSVSAVLPNFYAAAAVWLLHDLIGASFWVPVQNTIVQEYSRPEERGSDVSKTLALGALGGIIGPFLAGYLAAMNVSAPYFFSGIFVVIAVIPLLKLRLSEKPLHEETHPPEVKLVTAVDAVE